MDSQLTIFLLLSETALAVCTTLSSDVPLLSIIPFFPDYSFSSRRIACSEQEQECFKENKLLYEADGKCHSVGGQGPCAEGEIFHADKAEALRKGGHLRGTCHKPCPGVDNAPLAATGECMARSEVEEKICRADLYLRPEMDGFGQWVCEWSIQVCLQEDNNLDIYDRDYNGICSPPVIFSSSITARNRTINDVIPSDHPLLQYFSNNTYLEHEFSCTEQEKACLHYGRMLGRDGNCYSPNEFPPNCNNGETFHLDWAEAIKENGRLEWICSSNCKDSKRSQSENKCLNSYEFYQQICISEWGLKVDEDMFRRLACRCSHVTSKSQQPSPSLPPPAKTPGYCRLPDFSNPVRSPVYDETLTLGFSLPCSEEEYACFREGKVLMNGTCHTLRTRGPCAQGEELVLDKEALAHARLQPKCAPSPCPEGSVRMPIDGRCLTYQQARSLLCPNSEIALDEFGGWQCSFSPNWPADLSTVIRHNSNGTCELPARYTTSVLYSWKAGGSVSGG